MKWGQLFPIIWTYWLSGKAERENTRLGSSAKWRKTKKFPFQPDRPTSIVFFFFIIFEAGAYGSTMKNIFYVPDMYS